VFAFKCDVANSIMQLFGDLPRDLPVDPKRTPPSPRCEAGLLSACYIVY